MNGRRNSSYFITNMQQILLTTNRLLLKMKKKRRIKQYLIHIMERSYIITKALLTNEIGMFRRYTLYQNILKFCLVFNSFKIEYVRLIKCVLNKQLPFLKDKMLFPTLTLDWQDNFFILILMFLHTQMFSFKNSSTKYVLL